MAEAALGANPAMSAESRKRSPWWLVSCLFSWVLGAVFIYAGILKVLDPVQFARDIDNYQMLPWPISLMLAFYLPWLEILCGLTLLIRRLYTGGLAVVSALVVVFIAASVTARLRGIDITCGCFGHFSQGWSFSRHLLIDLLLLGLVVVLWALQLRSRRDSYSS